MKISGEHVYEYPQDVVWQALLDPEVLKRTLPGCEDLQQTGENEFAGKLKMKVGPVQGVFQGEVKLRDLDPPNGYGLDLQGKGAPGFVNGSGTITLAPHEQGTTLSYDIDAQVGGRIASVGQRLLDSSAKVITKQGLTGLGKQLEARVPAATEAEASPESPEAGAGAATPSGQDADGGAETPTADQAPAPAPDAPEAPSQAEFATEFAKGLAEEFVPRRHWGWIGTSLVLLAVAAVFVVMRTCGAGS